MKAKKELTEILIRKELPKDNDVHILLLMRSSVMIGPPARDPEGDFTSSIRVLVSHYNLWISFRSFITVVIISSFIIINFHYFSHYRSWFAS